MSIDKGVQVVFSGNVDPLKGVIKEATGAVQAGAEKMAQASTASTDKIAGGQKSLVQEYRAAYKAAQILAEQQGTNSTAFKEAANAAAQYKDKIDDVKDAIKGASQEQQWRLVSGAISSAASVAQGMVGVMSLLGIESESAEKSIQKMLALQGIAAAAKGIYDLKDAFVALNSVTKFSLIGIAATAAAWLVFKNAADQAKEAQKKLNEEQKKANDLIADYLLSAKQKEINAENEKFKEFEKILAKQTNLVANEYDSQGRIIIVHNAKVDAINKKAWAEYNEGFEKHKKTLADIEKKYAKDVKPVKVSEQESPFAFKLISKNVTADLQATSKEIIKMMDGLKSTKPITFEDFFDPEITNNLYNFVDNFDIISKRLDDIKNSIKASLIGGLGNVFQDLGAMWASGTGDISKSIANVVANIASELGTQLMALGIPLLFVPGFQGLGATYTAAGAALKLLAGAAGSYASQPVGGQGGGNNNGGGNNYSTGTPFNFQPTAVELSVGGMVRGNDLRVIAINTTRSNRRVR